MTKVKNGTPTPDHIRYPRTNEDFSLDEICYAMEGLTKGLTVDDLAGLLRRSPYLIRFKFMQLRPINGDGSLNMSKSVPSEDDPILTEIGKEIHRRLLQEFHKEKRKDLGRKKYQDWKKSQDKIGEDLGEVS